MVLPVTATRSGGFESATSPVLARLARAPCKRRASGITGTHVRWSTTTTACANVMDALSGMYQPLRTVLPGQF